MSTEHVTGLLGAYLDGELPSGERARVDVHLAGCAACSAELAELRALDAGLRGTAVPDPGPHYWSRFAERLETRLGPSTPSGYERLTGWLFPSGRLAWVRGLTAVATVTLLVFRTAFQQAQFGLGAALAFILTLVILLFTLVQFRVLGRRVQYG